jgi:hypothetical protein
MHGRKSERPTCLWSGFYRAADASIVHLENLLVRVKLLPDERIVDANLRRETELITKGPGDVSQKIPSSRGIEHMRGGGEGTYLPEFVFDDSHLQAVILGQDVVHCKRGGLGPYLIGASASNKRCLQDPVGGRQQ